MIDLDQLSALKANDTEDMLGRIGELPAQVQQAWAAMTSFELPPGYEQVAKLVIAGMGGSAIGGALVQALAEPECPIPIAVVRDYHLPAYVDENTLVVASSYSGNTEETLSALEDARNAGAKVVALTSNGRLATLATEQGFPAIRFSYDAQPRAALGHSFTRLLGLLVRLNLIEDKKADITEAVDVMTRLQRVIGPDVPTSRNPAKALAQQLVNRVPTVYAAGVLKPVAQRWKGQFNENAKTWAAFDEMPELNHNSVVGYGNPAHLAETAFVILLRSPLESPRIDLRFEITAELLDQAQIPHTTVSAWGESPLAHMLSAIHYGDYVSYYLAALHGVDPTPIPPINYLKQKLG